MLEAVGVGRAASLDPSSRAALERLRDGDPSLKVREAAREALAASRPPAASRRAHRLTAAERRDAPIAA